MDLLVNFMEDFNKETVDEGVISAFEAAKPNQGYAPHTLRTFISLLKKVCISRRFEIPSSCSLRLNAWVDNIGKQHVPKQSPVFSRADIINYLQNEKNTYQMLQRKAWFRLPTLEALEHLKI